MNSFLIEPTASGMWHLTRHNEDGTYTYEEAADGWPQRWTVGSEPDLLRARAAAIRGAS